MAGTNMKSELAEEIFQLIETRSHARPTPMEFEMAYQARVAIDRIRFAIKHTEKFAPQTDELREAELQLLDALERLERVDRRFQQRSGLRADFSRMPNTPYPPVNGTDGKGSQR
jgi:hypothetical protein